jgi:hypothetical protein
MGIVFAQRLEHASRRKDAAKVRVPSEVHRAAAPGGLGGEAAQQSLCQQARQCSWWAAAILSARTGYVRPAGRCSCHPSQSAIAPYPPPACCSLLFRAWPHTHALLPFVRLPSLSTPSITISLLASTPQP